MKSNELTILQKLKLQLFCLDYIMINLKKVHRFVLSKELHLEQMWYQLHLYSTEHNEVPFIDSFNDFLVFLEDLLQVGLPDICWSIKQGIFGYEYGVTFFKYSKELEAFLTEQLLSMTNAPEEQGIEHKFQPFGTATSGEHSILRITCDLKDLHNLYKEINSNYKTLSEQQ